MSNWGKTEQHLLERNCPICGKNFVLAPEHMYRDGTKKVCGWNCQCEAERRKEAERARKKVHRGKSVDPNRNGTILRMATDGTPLKDIADAVGLSLEHVRRIINANKCVK